MKFHCTHTYDIMHSFKVLNYSTNFEGMILKYFQGVLYTGTSLYNTDFGVL